MGRLITMEGYWWGGGAYNYYTHVHSQKVLDEHIVIYFRPN